jgi:hypothetical protein
VFKPYCLQCAMEFGPLLSCSNTGTPVLEEQEIDAATLLVQGRELGLVNMPRDASSSTNILRKCCGPGQLK